jgi:hypothetical protein
MNRFSELARQFTGARSRSPRTRKRTGPCVAADLPRNSSTMGMDVSCHQFCGSLFARGVMGVARAPCWAGAG